MDLQAKVKLFRERFYGRQDVYGRQWSAQKEGATLRGYAPVCGNLWKDFCHLKLKDGVQCTKCEHREWAPVTDESVKKHILGEEIHIYYVLQTDGMIKFGAMDFDMKAGKEDKGYGFEDVMRVSNMLKMYGVPHYIARSTGDGYHLYIFFEDFCPAYKFRSFALEIYDRVGFMQYVQQGTKPLPEFFPKQSYAGRDGIGNGIKPPMIEPQIEKGRNCWVNENNDVIIDQWNYFTRMNTITSARFDEILQAESIPLLEAEIAPGQESTLSSGHYLSRGHSGKWQHPISGSIEKVMEGCLAFRRIREKVLKGEILGHSEGFALYHMCLHTQDGLEWFKKNVKGWGDTDKDIKQLEHSMDKNYLPWTCRKLQENAICQPGTQCFEKKPPREIVDGMEVFRDDIPKDRWPEPSPVRYAYGKGEDYLLKLKEEVVALKDAKDHTSKVEGLKEIAKRIQVFDETQQKEFKEYVREQKPLKRNEISKILNEASDNYEEETKKQIKSRDDAIVYDDNYYMRAEPAGYIFIKKIKDGKKKEIRLCSIDIVVKEERTYHIEEGDTRTYYVGVVKMPGLEKHFEINIDSWFDNSKFVVYFGQLLGSSFCPLRLNIEYIRQAALAFSKVDGIEKSVYLTTQGYYGDTYLMPTCVVDATGIRPNTSQKVELGFKETKHIDFQMLSDSELVEVLLHLKTEFLTTWPEIWTYTGLAHTLTPVVMPTLDWHKRVTLFYEGLTGGGKSELTHALQYFWGRFPSLANFFSSSKGIRELSYQFKDTCLVVDDFKGISKEQISAVKDTILRAYDGSSEFRCKSTAELKGPRATRCIFMMSGEEFIANDAAVVARTVLIETHKHDTRKTEAKYVSVHKHRNNYSGVTPHFISWFLRRDKASILDVYNTFRLELKEGHHLAQNIDRVVHNLAANWIVWTLFTNFLVDYNAATSSEKEMMDAKHRQHILSMRNRMVERCAAEQSSEVFIRVLSQLILSGEVAIDGLPGFNPERKVIVGFVPKSMDHVICLLPKMVLDEVKNRSRNAPILGTEASILRQLDDQGALAAKDKNHLTKNFFFKGAQVRAWCVRQSALGIDPSVVEDFSDGKVLAFRQPMNAKKEDFGIF